MFADFNRSIMLYHAVKGFSQTSENYCQDIYYFQKLLSVFSRFRMYKGQGVIFKDELK